MLKTKKAKTLAIKKTLPKSFTEAAGLLRHKKTDLYKHLKQIRREWDRSPVRV